ncbi:hypothetical protein LTR62_000698 [Meristemomyces frigidus]|uniref:DUF6697 domain-containing protein n=1 Tax=Meristemomyces frigidus TaxID=1508187 RepID=A0AAN7T9Z2_9PEZI|nr:hypothetical protein LTR62_000698 [Meristemomyces frigidus]
MTDHTRPTSPSHYSLPTMGPTAPRFQPNGNEVARYQPSVDTSTALERYVAGFQVSTVAEIARLELATKNNADDIELTNKIVRGDLQTLQAEIAQLRELVTSSVKHQAASAITRASNLPAQDLSRNGPTAVHSDGAEPNERPNPIVIKEPSCDVNYAVRLAATLQHLNSTRPKWQPLAVHQMQPSPTATLPTTKVTFSWEFLQRELQGAKWSPGYHLISGETSKIKSRGYWILEAEFEPFAPSAPGQHGAKLTPFFNCPLTLTLTGPTPEEENFLDNPVFIRKEGEERYAYFGQYSQLRFSDKLDYDRVLEVVPESVRQYWANQLADPRRPMWITKALKEHFWPRPRYEGPLPKDSVFCSPGSDGATTCRNPEPVLEKNVRDGMIAYAAELKAWDHETGIKVNLLTPESLLASFKEADAAMEPGLRLWWEYFQCVGYEQEFYADLVRAQEEYEKSGGVEAIGQVGVKWKAGVRVAKDDGGESGVNRKDSAVANVPAMGAEPAKERSEVHSWSEPAEEERFPDGFATNTHVVENIAIGTDMQRILDWQQLAAEANNNSVANPVVTSAPAREAEPAAKTFSRVVSWSDVTEKDFPPTKSAANNTRVSESAADQTSTDRMLHWKQAAADEAQTDDNHPTWNPVFICTAPAVKSISTANPATRVPRWAEVEAKLAAAYPPPPLLPQADLNAAKEFQRMATQAKVRGERGAYEPPHRRAKS